MFARRLWCLVATLLLMAAAQADEAAVQQMLRVEAGSHVAAIRAMALDARGELLLTASEDKTARLWRLSDRSLLRVLRPPIGPDNEGKLYAAALSPDGTVAAVAGWSADNEIYLFNSRDGQLRSRIAGLPNVVNALTFSPDGKLLAVLLWGGQGLRLYTSADGWQSAQLVSDDSSYGADAYGLAFSPDGKLLATSAYDGRVRLYAVRGASLWLQKAQTLEGHPHGLAFSPDSRQLAVGSADSSVVRVLAVDGLGTQWQSAPQEGGALNCVAWSRDGKTLFAGGSWRSAPGRHGLRSWNMSSHAGSELPAASDSITALVSSAQATFFASGDASWGQVGGAVQRSLRADFRLPMALGPSSLRVSDDGRELSFATRFGGLSALRFDLSGPTWRAAPQALDAPPSNSLDIRDWQDNVSPRLGSKVLALGPGEMSLTLGRDGAGRGFALGTNHRLRLYAADGKLLWSAPVPAPCFAVQLSRDGRWVVGGFGDGTLRWYRRNDGAEVLAFYPHGDGKAWAAWTPDGRFAAGSGGEAHVGWHLNRGSNEAAEFLPLARFSERYFDPLGVVSAVSNKPQLRPVPDLRAGLQLPPLVQFTSPKTGLRVDEETVHLDLNVLDRGGGVDEVRLMHNGKVVQTTGPQKGSPSRLQFDLPLEGGSNLVQAVAIARDRTESAAAEVTVQAPTRPDKPQLRVLSVGVNKYRNGAMNLSFSVPDARGVADTFKDLGRKLFAAIAVSELYDSDATRAGILARLKEFASSSNPQDVVVVYLAGHGETLGDDWYFIPYEVTQPEQPEHLRREGLSSRELAAAIKAIPARKVVVLIDACKSGAALANFRGLEERRLLAQLSRATGTHLIAATSKEQLASEVLKLGHGVFTYTLLEGLAGKAAAGGPDVTAHKLIAYVEQALPVLSLRYGTEEQFPVVSSMGMDFPLVVR